MSAFLLTPPAAEPLSLEDAKLFLRVEHDADDELIAALRIHHIVERASARDDGYPSSMINSPENLVRIPRYKHWELNRWYETENEDYDDLTPREYVRDKGWDLRVQVGLRGLIEVGVLKP